MRDEMQTKIQLLVNLRWTVQTIVPSVILLLSIQGLRLAGPSNSILAINSLQSTGHYLVSLWPNWILTVFGLGVNFLYQKYLKTGKNLRPIAHAQIWMDTILFALVIFNTGGITSPFTFLYTIPILASSLLLSMRASLAVAGLATLLVMGQAGMQWSGILHA